jgi:hypothetical protein
VLRVCLNSALLFDAPVANRYGQHSTYFTVGRVKFAGRCLDCPQRVNLKRKLGKFDGQRNKWYAFTMQ